MPDFVLSYRAPTDYVPGMPDQMAAWHKWFQVIGADLKDFGRPVTRSGRVGGGQGETSLNGYSIISAEDFEAASAIASACPMVAAGGAVELGQLGDVAGRP